MKRFTAVLAASLCAGASAATVDLADPASGGMWLSHPAIGHVSYDAFTRAANNPVYTGKPPYEWPVNGFLFRDPPTGDWYCYISLYPKGYWPAGPTTCLRSRDQGRTWEDLGIILKGDPNRFDGDGKQAGATLDPTVVMDETGYHMAYGWAKPDNSDGGIAYAHATSPAGPWIRDPKPIHAESQQPLLPPGYKRVYASSLIRRAKDWLIISSMSTPRNAGGMWANVALTAPTPQGPWTGPIFLHKPQDPIWLPQPVEFFPAFTHQGHVYASLTSVASNRSYQIIFKAPVEEAHKPESWICWRAGTLFHNEPNRHEAHGIWGQTFTGFVDPAGMFAIMYPSRNPDNVGTINIASRPWDSLEQHGFWLSAPNAPSLGLILRSYSDFDLQLKLHAVGPWQLLWNHRAPLGPDRAHAESSVSPLSLRDCTMLSVEPQSCRIIQIGADGTQQVLSESRGASGAVRLRIRQQGHSVELDLNGEPAKPVRIEGYGGAIGLLAPRGTYLQAERFALTGDAGPLTVSYLPLEGLLGAGFPEARWQAVKEGFRFGTGYIGDFEGARAKWSFEGSAVRLWSPRGPEFGKVDVHVDQMKVATVDLRADTLANSGVVLEKKLAPGRHALLIVPAAGTLPVDSIDVTCP